MLKCDVLCQWTERCEDWNSYLNFSPGISNFKSGVYCQQCGYAIWITLQSSQFCTACGFGVHYTCMDNIMRTCVALKAKSQPDFIMDICPERILPQLKYRKVHSKEKVTLFYFEFNCYMFLIIFFSKRCFLIISWDMVVYSFTP